MTKWKLWTPYIKCYCCSPGCREEMWVHLAVGISKVSLLRGKYFFRITFFMEIYFKKITHFLLLHGCVEKIFLCAIIIIIFHCEEILLWANRIRLFQFYVLSALAKGFKKGIKNNFQTLNTNIFPTHNKDWLVFFFFFFFILGYSLHLRELKYSPH